jgi:predicted nucleotidyltransferase
MERPGTGVHTGRRATRLVSGVATDGATSAARVLPSRDLLERIVARATATPDIVGLLVFGSFATGTEDEHSDLDLGLYVAPDAWPGFDLRAWLAPIAAVVSVHVTEHCSIVLFRELIRAEIHLGPADLADVWPSLAGVIAYPSIERMVRLDRTGRFRSAVEPLVGRLPVRTRAELETVFLSLTDGLLVAEGCRRRGDLARAIRHLATAQTELLRLVRYRECAFDEWVAPERSLAADLSASAYERYARATAQLDGASIRVAIGRSWEWGAEIATAEGVQPFDEETVAALDARLLKG